MERREEASNALEKDAVGMFFVLLAGTFGCIAVLVFDFIKELSQ